MKSKLKQLRVTLGMTQAKVAAAVGVKQPNYQRWESGAAPIPEAKLQKLAKVLKTEPLAILGKHAPIEAGFHDDSVDADLAYYGEVAIHFLSGGTPLLLSISEGAFTRLHRDLQTESAFVTVKSLANQTVVARTNAIADLYFSSEAYDDYGPEHGAYDNHIDVQLPDPRDWEIVEALAADGAGLEDFDPAHVQRIRERIMITDEQYKRLLAEGRIKSEDLERERAKNKEETDLIFRAALEVTYQLSTGSQRSAYVDGPEKLFDAFYELTDFDGGVPADGMIRLEAEGRHRVVFISKRALDYVVIPTHKYARGRVESDAAELDETSD